MNKSDIKHIFAIFVLSLIILSTVVTTAAADTSVAWTKDIGDVTAADMSEDGSVIYAAVGSQVFVYDSAGVQQNTFTVGGNVVKLVCTADGTRAALYTDGNDVYYIDNGALSWSQSFTAITDIDISNVGNVLIVEGTQFHKYLSNGSLEYNSASGTYNLGAIDPNDEFAIIQSNSVTLQKYLLTTTNQYWAKVGNNSFSTVYQDYQNLLIINPNTTEFPIKLTPDTISEDVMDDMVQSPSIRVSNDTLTTINSDQYEDIYNNDMGVNWVQETSATFPSAVMPKVIGYNGKLWAFFPNQVWSSTDGITWSSVTTSPGWNIAYNSLEVFVAQGKLVVVNLRAPSGSTGGAWTSTDGVTWTHATSSPGWSNSYSGVVKWNLGVNVWFGAGGRADIWSSLDGVTWQRKATNSPIGTRVGAACWQYKGQVWVAGGTAGGNALNDVWVSSNGVSWSQVTTSAQWSPRAYSANWVWDNKMWIAGGSNGESDVWFSEDGINWTEATASAQWSPRQYSVSWVKDNMLWIAGGSQKSDVWHSRPSVGGYVIQPSQEGTTYIFYNYTGSNPQHVQTTYTNAINLNGSYETRNKPTLSIYALQTSKSFTGNIASISLSDRGDWLGTATTTNIYHDQITSSGFGTEYYATLGSTGTVYDVSTANSAAMSILGQGQITDIYSMSASRVGTYTAGGAVTHVDIADKNALWAASGGEDGKVYIFSKDASSNWYLEYSSDSENPITALKMSARGEYILAGRTNSLTLYQTNTPEVVQTDFWFTLYAYKDSDSYRNAAVNVSVYSGNQWNSFAQGLTDSAGKYVVQLTAGQTYKFDVGNGQKVVVVMASPSVQSQTVNIHTSPISEAISYKAVWNEEINGIDLKYNDNSGQTNSVTVKVQRTDTWETVYEETFTGTQNIDEQLPIVDDTTSYKVQFSANRVSGTSRNSFVLSSSRDIIPIPLDQNIKNVLFSCFLIVLAGLFSYMSAIRGALVVAFSATLFVYLGWLTIPWHWLIIAIVIAIVAGFTQRRG